MSEIKESSNWSIIPQLENGDILTAGVGGLINEQAKAIADRTLFLCEEIEKVIEDVANSSGKREELLTEMNNLINCMVFINNGQSVYWEKPLFSRVWVSTEQLLPTLPTPIVIRHDLSLEPSKVRVDVRLKCVVADLGYQEGEYCGSWGLGPCLAPLPMISESEICFASGIKYPTWALIKGSSGKYSVKVENWRYVFRFWY